MLPTLDLRLVTGLMLRAGSRRLAGLAPASRVLSAFHLFFVAWLVLRTFVMLLWHECVLFFPNLTCMHDLDTRTIEVVVLGSRPRFEDALLLRIAMIHYSVFSKSGPLRVRVHELQSRE